MLAGQCDNQMGTKFWEVVRDEGGIGGYGGDCGDNDAQLGRINVFPRGLGRQVLPRAVLFDLEPGVIDAVRASPLDTARRGILPPG
jgi:tubulin beta